MDEILLADWIVGGEHLFGDDRDDWQFRCPACNIVQSRRDFRRIGMHDRQANKFTGFACYRRWTDQSCMQLGGPVSLIVEPNQYRPTFEFYEKPHNL